jgi:hypothetical protein
VSIQSQFKNIVLPFMQSPIEAKTEEEKKFFIALYKYYQKESPGCVVTMNGIPIRDPRKDKRYKDEQCDGK